MLFDRIGVAGAGAWGTALANAAARSGREVLLWTRDPAHAREMAEKRENHRRLPGVALEDAVTPVADLARLHESQALLLVTPAQTVRAMSEALAPVVAAGAPVVVCAKGIERGTGLFLDEVATGILPAHPVAVLSGPSFAEDVSRGLPTAVSLACSDAGVATALARALSGATFRVYHGTDVRGVEIGGAAKNVLAIAAGIVAGAGLGESAKAALVARGFAELGRFAKAYGGRPETLMGLSGLGDLVLTCGSSRSRNFALGEGLGRGEDAAVASGGKLAEGVYTADVLVSLARGKAVDMPIADAVADVLGGRATVTAVVDRLMNRPLKSEG